MKRATYQELSRQHLAAPCAGTERAAAIQAPAEGTELKACQAAATQAAAQLQRHKILPQKRRDTNKQSFRVAHPLQKLPSRYVRHLTSPEKRRRAVTEEIQKLFCPQLTPPCHNVAGLTPLGRFLTLQTKGCYRAGHQGLSEATFAFHTNKNTNKGG